MREFRLPDTWKALGAKEGKLREELALRHTEYQLVCMDTPRGEDPKRTPEFYSLLVAHRRWQHAYEKRLLIRRKERV